MAANSKITFAGERSDERVSVNSMAQYGEDDQDNDMSRRAFVKSAAAITASAIVPRQFAAAGDRKAARSGEGAGAYPPSEQVPKRKLGKTGAEVSALGVGGYHLGSAKDQQEANEIVARALDSGITFFDNAWDYHNGASEERLGIALRGKRDRAFVMTKVCTHGRDKDVAMQMLEQSLRRLQTDHLDLWQIHEVIYYNDPDLIFRPNGAAEALATAKQQGKVRFVGFTGHKDPSIHLRMLKQGFPFDTVQMPLNAFDATFRSFETQVLPEAAKQGVAVLGMKSLGGSGEMVTNGAITAEEGLRYAMSLPVATTISGMDSVGVLEQNLAIARGFRPMADAEMQTLRDRVKMYAADGRYELFKTTKKYDGDVGREQHHYPPPQKLPA
jgi:aryl-alcohol dehydrogenase-like predicted oxidoreductase